MSTSPRVNQPPAGVNQPPAALIASPAEGTTFQAGDTLAFSGSATDPEDGAEPATRLTWWADLHHDTHEHPFQPETTGGSGTVTIPTRNETSDNIWYRFHLRATDSAGLSTEVTRDVLPRKVQVTLATQPAGLALTLDGQPVTAPTTFTGVVGIERDLGAADQQANGRSYRFDSWSDGQAASHTIATPASSTTYTATFIDIGPANQAPSVALSAAANGTVGSAMALTATAADSDGSVTRVEFFDGATSLNVDTAAPFTFSWTPGTAGTHALTAVATDDQGATTRSAAVSVNVAAGSGADMQPPNIALTSPADLAQNLVGTLSLTATASDNVGVIGVEFQVDGQTVGSEVTSAPYSVTVDSTVYAFGQHIIRARARDAAGNVSAWSRITVTFGSTPRLPAGFSMNDSWITGMGQSTAFAQAPDGRIFVAERVGRLRVIKNGTLLPTVFHQFTADTSGERGLLGLAFHPDFANNGYVYVYYTATTPSAHNRISRVVANGDVSTGAETFIVDLPNLPARSSTTVARSTSALTASSMRRSATTARPPTRPTSRWSSARCCASTTTARSRPTTRSTVRRPGLRGRCGRTACAIRSPSLSNPAPVACTSTTSDSEPGRRSTSAWPARTTVGPRPRDPIVSRPASPVPFSPITTPPPTRPGRVPGGSWSARRSSAARSIPLAATSQRRTATATSSPTTSRHGSDGSTR